MVLELEDIDLRDTTMVEIDYFKVKPDESIQMPPKSSYANDMEFDFLNKYAFLKVRLPSPQLDTELLKIVQ